VAVASPAALDCSEGDPPSPVVSCPLQPSHGCLSVQDFPAKWIYEPWKAPIADQKKANCRVGVDYPKPIVDHASVSKDNIQKLKDAYADQSPSKSKPPSHATTAAAVANSSHARRKQAISSVGMPMPKMCTL